MSNFIIAVGHTASGNVGCGVVDRLDESDCNRAIGALVEKVMELIYLGLMRVINITVRIATVEQFKLIK